MPRLRIVVAMLVVALAVVGGASGSAKDTSLSLVAYSTPKTVFGKIIQAWQQTPGRQGRLVHPVLRRLDRPGEGRRRRPERPTSSSSRPGDDVNLLVDAGLVDSKWDKQRYNGIAADTVVVFAVRNGNPKHIKGWNDLVKPGVQVVTPNPFSSGSAKWNILAAYGAQRRLGKTDKQATAYVQKLFQHVVSQDTSGRNATNTFLVRQGRRAAHLRERGDQLAPAAGTGHPVRDPAPDDADRAADRGAQVELEQGRGERVHPVHRRSTPAQDLFAQYGFRPVNKQIAAKYADEVPGAARHLHDRRQDDRRLAHRRQEVVRPEQRAHGQDRAGGRRADLWLARAEAAAGARRATRRTRERAGTALSLGFVTAYPLADRRAADRGARVGVAKRRRPARSGTSVSSPEAVAALKLTLVVAALVALDERRARHDHRLGARPRRLPRQGARQRGDRPAVRAADDRRRARAARALRAAARRSGINVAFTRTAIFLALLFVTLPFVVRTVQPVLLELDTEMEEAARSLGASELTVFRRIVLPNILPGILSGVALAFARAVGEIGALVLISGQPAVQDRGRVGLRLQPDPERRPRRRGGRRGRAARRSRSRCCSRSAGSARLATRHERA